MEEEQVFQAELSKIGPDRREQVMEIVTSWMEKGIEQGKRTFVRRMLNRRLGTLESQMEARIDTISDEQLEQLAETLFDFTTVSDLAAWLNAHGNRT